jgi:DNA-binding NarL/FixJ family response regulator
MNKSGNNIKKIMIVDDHPIVREGLSKMIEKEKDFVICGESSNANDAIRKINDIEPDIVIVDISLEGSVNGIDLVKAIKERYPEISTLVLSMYNESLYAERAIKAGASGYISKRKADKIIIKAIRTILNKDLYLSDDIAQSLLKKSLQKSTSKEKKPESALSDRELEIFIMIGNGLSMKEVAERLSLSLNTVETHRRHIRDKMEYKNLNELIKSAVRWVMLQNE